MSACTCGVNDVRHGFSYSVRRISRYILTVSVDCNILSWFILVFNQSTMVVNCISVFLFGYGAERKKSATLLILCLQP